MNFNYSEDQLAIKEVADRIFRDLCGDDAIKQCFKSGQPFHAELWQQLAGAGLLATSLPADLGGSEMGMTELSIVLEGQGRSVAPVPVVESIVACAMPDRHPVRTGRTGSVIWCPPSWQVATRFWYQYARTMACRHCSHSALLPAAMAGN
ncbi:MAG: acyl-CoA dehydrogenase family protein [Gammaproteobacteria bacterium]